MSKMMVTQLFRPKFILMTLALIVCCSANPIPDDIGSNVTGQVSNFFDRAKNTISPDPAKKDDPNSKLTTWEIVGIVAAAVVLFFILFCCIGYCLCECVKEILCCICCCCRD